MRKPTGLKKYFLISILPAVIAALPLFGSRFIPTHDGEYHIIRFAEFFSMLENGYLFPRWAPTLNSGYGIPLFNFHYPLPNYVGALFHLFGLSFVTAFKYSLAAGYLLSVVFCFFWLKKLFSQAAATVGTIVFSYIPYWFVDIYVRGSVGEVLGMAWIMLALAAIEYRKQLLLAVSLALTILTHNILAMIFFPILLVYMIIRQPKLVYSMLLGILMSSYFWLPALVERQYVVGLNTVSFGDHFPLVAQLLFPSWGTGFSVRELTSDEMSFQIGVVPVTVLVLAFIYRKKLDRHRKKMAIVFFAIVAAAFYCMTEASGWLWRMVGVLQLIQYPWRLLAIFLPVVAFFAGFAAQHTKRFVGVGLCVLAVIVAFSYTRPVTYEPRADQHYLTRPEFTQGTSSMGNTFSTRWTDWKQVLPEQRIEFIEGEGSYMATVTRPLEYRGKVASASDAKIRAHILYYPGWTVYIDGQKAHVEYETDGLISFAVPKGEHTADIVFQETSVRIIANILSCLGLFSLPLWFILNLFYAHRDKHATARKRA